MNCILVLDIGGSFIKSALASQTDGLLLPGTEFMTPTHSNGLKSEFLASLSETVRHARQFGHEVSCASVCIPGPFDYDNGVALMQHKFRAIYQESLTSEFQSMGLSVVYLHDSTAFLLGELRYGAAKDFRSPVGVMLGTGFGFAMAHEGKVCVSADQRPSVRLWDKPYEDGIVEDYVSQRAIRTLYQAYSGCAEIPEVREIGTLADAGDRVAQSVFHTVGEHIGKILLRYIPAGIFDCLVLGGQIARSYEFIIPDIQRSIPVPVFPALHISDAALRGAAGYFLQGKNNSIQIMTEMEALSTD